MGFAPDFLLNFVALIQTLRLSSRKGARVALSSAAWQEIRVAVFFGPRTLVRTWGTHQGWLGPLVSVRAQTEFL